MVIVMMTPLDDVYRHQFTKMLCKNTCG